MHQITCCAAFVSLSIDIAIVEMSHVFVIVHFSELILLRFTFFSFLFIVCYHYYGE